jgi:hypothetical protein
MSTIEAFAANGSQSLPAVSTCRRPPITLMERYAFIQPSPTKVFNYSTEQWKKKLVEMRDIGVTSIIWQWSENDAFANDLANNVSRLSIVSYFAQRYGMKLFVGTQHPVSWNNIPNGWRPYNTYVAANNAVAQAVVNAGICVDGWYVPTEIATIELNKNQWTNTFFYTDFYAQINAGLRSIANKPILHSPYISTHVSQAQDANARPYVLSVDHKAGWLDFINRSGFDVILIQDGVGAQGTSVSFAQAYIKAIQTLARSKEATRRVQIVPNVEVFNASFVTASTGAVKSQICAQLQNNPAQLAFFDYPHYADKTDFPDMYNTLKNLLPAGVNSVSRCR